MTACFFSYLIRKACSVKENGLRIFTSGKSDSYDIIRIFRKEKCLLMDCSNHQQNACTSRPQISPCMSAGCGCGGKPIRPTNPIQPVIPNQGQGIKPSQDGCMCQNRKPVQHTMPGQNPMPRQGSAPCQSSMPCQGSAPCQGSVPCQNTGAGIYPPGMWPTGGGFLSEMPLAMAYAPMQRWTQTYTLSQGLERGTIFPDLDLPFMMGRCR